MIAKLDSFVNSRKFPQCEESVNWPKGVARPKELLVLISRRFRKDMRGSRMWSPHKRCRVFFVGGQWHEPDKAKCLAVRHNLHSNPSQGLLGPLDGWLLLVMFLQRLFWFTLASFAPGDGSDSTDRTHCRSAATHPGTQLHTMTSPDLQMQKKLVNSSEANASATPRTEAGHAVDERLFHTLEKEESAAKACELKEAEMFHEAKSGAAPTTVGSTESFSYGSYS
jgi:hypothetical protein